MLFSFSANSSVSSGKKHKVGCTVQHPRNKKTFCQNKKLSARPCVELFWWARVDVASRAYDKESGLRLPASASLPLASCWPRPQPRLPVSATGGGRLRCCSNPPARHVQKEHKTKSSAHVHALSSFGGRGWITQAAHLKKPRRGFFPRRTVRRVDAVRIHPR